LQVLKQEGWHYEIEEPGGPLTFKGVVYNEMKVRRLRLHSAM
jgi:Zn-dependent M16 (insulinase) family peptidase